MNVRQGMVWLVGTLAAALPLLACGQQTIDIGQRRELFVDRYLVDELRGECRLQLQQPEPREVVLTTDKPWEGNISAYFTVFQDDDRYRMYYRGAHWDEQRRRSTHPEFTCYAESRDGIHWEKPELGLFDFDGSRRNNIVWSGVGTHCFTVSKDANPACPPQARYKAISRGRPQRGKGLYVFQSPDALHWKLVKDTPVITAGAFDSQNLAFWDPHRDEYRAYFRTFRDGVRTIATATSKNFTDWSQPQLLQFPNAPNEHLYTNAVQPYSRAPHLLIGFPTRYLPKEGQRVEPTLMSSRDRRTFHRWLDPVIPESAPQDRAGNRSNYMAWGLFALPGKPNELSVYATEAYYTGPDSRLRRFAYRTDGFVAVEAAGEGELITQPLRFAGEALEINFKTRDGGSLRVALLDATGKAIEGYSLTDCDTIRGDSLERRVAWRGESRLPKGRTVARLRFQFRDASLYSFQVSGNAQAAPK